MFLRGFFDLNYSRGADKSVVVGYVIQNYNRTQLDQAALFSITAKLSLQLSGPSGVARGGCAPQMASRLAVTLGSYEQIFYNLKYNSTTATDWPPQSPVSRHATVWTY